MLLGVRTYLKLAARLGTLTYWGTLGSPIPSSTEGALGSPSDPSPVRILVYQIRHGVPQLRNLYDVKTALVESPLPILPAALLQKC